MVRVVRTGCVAAAVVAALLPAAAPATASTDAVESTRPTTFVEALAALPQAADRIAATRVVVRDARARLEVAQSVAVGVRAALVSASDELHERTLLRTRTELAAAAAQASLDDVARQMYSSGGTAPSLVDVMMTAESEDSLMQSLVTRQYLSTVADDQVDAGVQINTASVAAASTQRQAALEWNMAAENWRGAASGLRTATRDLAAAQAVSRRARQDYKTLMKLTEVDHSADYGRIKTCGDWLIKLLAKTGFKGENLREAWAIVMRESGGRADAVSRTNDLGLFQINTDTWQAQPWFDRESLLKRKFNAKVGYLLSQGGSSWYSWGLDGHGRPDPGAYLNAGWSEERIVAKIIEPYIAWYSLYPCRPAYEKNDWEKLGIDLAAALKPRSEDDGSAPLAVGGGVLPSQASAGAEPPTPEPVLPSAPAPPVETTAPSSSEPAPVEPTPSPVPESS